MATEWPTTPVKPTCYKKKETVKEHKASKAAETAMKHSANTKAVKPLLEAGVGLTRIWVTVSTVCAIIDYTNGAVSLDTPVVVLVHNTKGNIVAMSQLPEELSPLPISAGILRGKTGRCSVIHKNL